MAKDTTRFTIREADLAVALEISRQRLDEIVDFFDANPSDEWELRENDHFIFLNKSQKERLFSQHGAYAIAKYMDSIEPHSLWDKIKEFITRHKEKLRNAFIEQTIYENCSSLTIHSGRPFLSKKDTVSILCTSYARLNQAFREVQKTEFPLAIYEDFDDIDGVRYYSLSGFNRLSRELSKSLKSRDRQEWCKAVELVGKKVFKQITDEQSAHEKRIEAAKRKVKKTDKETCQITGEKSTKYNTFNVSVHHIYCAKAYPSIATSEENLITLKESIHQEFHNWNGGFQKPCTADDLIRFITEVYPDKTDALYRLYQSKKIFGTIQPVCQLKTTKALPAKKAS